MRGDHMQVTLDVKRQPLGPSEPLEKGGNNAFGGDAPDRVMAGGTRSGDVKVAIRAKGKMVGRNAGLQRCEHKGTVVAINLEDGSAAVADKKITGRVEGNSCGNAQPLRHQIRLAVGSEAKDGARVAAGAEESALTIKRQAAGVGDGAAPG